MLASIESILKCEILLSRSFEAMREMMKSGTRIHIKSENLIWIQLVRVTKVAQFFFLIDKTFLK